MQSFAPLLPGGAWHQLVLNPSAARRQSSHLEASGDEERKNRFVEYCSLGCHRHTSNLSHAHCAWAEMGLGRAGVGRWSGGRRISGGRDFSFEPTVVPIVNGKLLWGGQWSRNRLKRKQKQKNQRSEERHIMRGAFCGFTGTVKLTWEHREETPLPPTTIT